MQVKKKTSPWFSRFLMYLLKRILVFDFVLVALTAASFLFYGEWSALAYSDRLFLVGVIVIGLGGLAMLIVTFTNKDFGNPGAIRTPQDARNLLENNLEIREGMEKRYNIATQLWLIGLGCIGFSILMYQILS
jgi:hypothetical protein